MLMIFRLFSTTDAAYFLLVAQQIKTHGSSESLIRKRSYPDFIDNVARNGVQSLMNLCWRFLSAISPLMHLSNHSR